jgi:alkaline phosphatase D
VEEPLTRLAFGSCADQDAPQPIWEAVLDFEPELFLFLGDNVYADTEDMARMRGEYSKLGAKEGFRKLRQRAQVLATWDDHDYGANDAGREYPRKQESAEVFREFWGQPHEGHDGIYTARYFGPSEARVQVLLLDLRSFRTSLARRPRTAEMRSEFMGPYLESRGPGVEMLGKDQWKWLAQELKKPARLRIIGSSTQFLQRGNGWETWSNFPEEQERLLALIEETRAEGVLFLSGDTHWAELSRLDRGYPLYDLTSSGLTEVWKGVAPNERRVGVPYLGANFGTLQIDWGPDDPVLLLEIRDLQGKTRIKQKLRLSDLSFDSGAG